MLSALWVSKTGLSAQDMNLTTISNNLANVSTTGFKRDRAEFQDLLYQIRRQPGGQSTQRQRAAFGPATGYRCARRRHPEDLHPGQPADHRAAAGHGGQRARLLPGPAAGRHRVLHPRRQLPPELRRADRHLQRLRPGASDRGAQRDPDLHRRPGRHRLGDHHRQRPAAGDRQHPDRRLHQPGRPAGHRQQPVPWKPAPAARPRSVRRVSTASARLPRTPWKTPTSTWSRNW